MTKLLTSLLVICLIAFQGLAQCGTDVYVSNLQTLMKAEHPQAAPVVKWLDKERTLQIGNELYPVGATTVLKWREDKEKGYSVEFFMQKGTAITQVDNPTFRRAWWTLSFSSKTSCREFVKLFEGLKKEVPETDS